MRPTPTVTNGTQTTVTDYPYGSGGTSTTATYLYSNGVEVADTNGDSATTYVNRDPATLLAEDTIDGNGNDTDTSTTTTPPPVGHPPRRPTSPQSLDGVGNTTQTQYTAANLPWCSVDAADYVNGTTCPGTEPTTPPTSPGPATGYTLTIYNAANQVTFATDPLGNTTTNSYTTRGLRACPMASSTALSTRPTTPRSVTCPAYGATHVAGTATKTFDANGDVLTSTDADGDTTSYTYGSAANPGLPTTTTDPDGNVTTDTYNAEGEVLTQVVTGTSGTYSATTQYGYDSAGRKFCEVDPYEYSESASGARPAPPTSPPTGTPGYTDTIYNSNGQVISTTNPIGGHHPVRLRRSRQPVLHGHACQLRRRHPVPDLAAPHHPDARVGLLPRGHHRHLRRRQPGRPGHQPPRGDHPHHLRRGRQRDPDHRRVQQHDHVPPTS